MRKFVLAAAVFTSAVFNPTPAHAWGFAGHRLIMARAIDLLPPALKPFFEHFKAEVVERATDPDRWRSVGWEDDPNHFIDFGMPELGPYPFAALPHDRDRALEKFGERVMTRVGFLPWRAAEMAGNLRRGFQGFAGQQPYATSDVTLFAPVTAHYLQDANQPFHATANYDGAMTGNAGIHARFERDLVEKFQSRLSIAPGAPVPIGDVREFAFETLLDSYTQVDAILKADTDAAAGKEFYDDDYFEKFFTRVKPILDRQLSRAVAATAGAIIGAWEAAGKPELRTQDARPAQRIRKSG